jgi:plasmid stabilization system protein ParE
MPNFGGASMAEIRRYHPLVADDLAEAVGYYDDISVDLGNRFRASLRSRLETITERPDSFGRIHQEMRAAMLDRFPYVVLFEHMRGAILILGLFHAASDRERWFEREL